ncbi:MAG: IS1 family transposase, partial [Bacteroidales bacterium]|nr:IS1 family transposase [Bacteroidales bacterium]
SVVCRKCGSVRYVKAGFVNTVQRYSCNDCGCHFTMSRRGVSVDVKRVAVHLYLEGMGFRAISRITGISDVAIAKWINPMKGNLSPIRKQRIRVTELHKLEHFFITKELFNKYGWLLIGIEENKDVCLFGSYTSGNCRLTAK